MKTFSFPKDFLFGTATAALQIEGGDKNNNWYEWCELGKITDGTHCIVANDHWNRVEEDIDLMKQLNSQTYRMGIEWSRIEPKPNEFNEEAMAHYRDEIEQLIKAGIHPLVTLHHFTNPLWLEKKGAWTNEESINHFLNFTNYVVDQLGDIVSDWVTINEPNVYLTAGYFLGLFPPGKKGNNRLYFKAAKNMVLAHLKAYKLIHQKRKERKLTGTKVGAAHHLRVFEPEKGTRIEKMSCNLLNRLFQGIFLEGMTIGKLIRPLGNGFPEGQGYFSDFMGINYYSRDIIRGSFNPLTMFGERIVKEGAPTNDLDWEIYPEGIYTICKENYEKYKLPIYITENGTCDAKDDFRTKYIYDHLFYLHRAISDGIPVQRYYHWTLMDNFEWLEGFSARFGLIKCNFDTLERVIRRSGHFYSELCKEKAVTQSIYDTYFKDQQA